MSKRKTTQLLAELKKLSAEAHDNIFRRIQLAADILADDDWIASVYGGDDLKARDALQHEHFHELNGTYTLGVLLSVHGMYPDESAWKEHRYNLQTMRALWEENREKDESQKIVRQRVTLDQYKEVQEQVEDAEREAKMAREVIASRDEEIGRMKEENRQLRETVATLRGRIEELERQVGYRAAG